MHRQIAAGIYVVIMSETATIGEINKLVRLGEFVPYEICHG